MMQKGIAGHVLRLAIIIVMLLALVPRLIFAFQELMDIIHQPRNREPSGNPMKVEGPLQNTTEPGRFVTKMKPLK
ncbi:MAG TPA: hypothetical protein VNU93_08360 [Verrucomicrobiae bacterium]|nr:hypothetical protein [Verrucomicrobiae bacterium]